MLPELQRAFDCHLRSLRRSFDLSPSLPLFPSRQHSQGIRAITRVQAHSIIKSAFAAAGIENDGRLGTHTLRETFARSVYKNSGNDQMVLKAALNHSSVAVTKRYLDVGEDAVVSAIARCDFTRRPRQGRAVPPPRPAALPATIPAAA